MRSNTFRTTLRHFLGTTRPSLQTHFFRSVGRRLCVAACPVLRSLARHLVPLLRAVLCRSCACLLFVVQFRQQDFMFWYRGRVTARQLIVQPWVCNASPLLSIRVQAQVSLCASARRCPLLRFRPYLPAQCQKLAGQSSVSPEIPQRQSTHSALTVPLQCPNSPHWKLPQSPYT